VAHERGHVNTADVDFSVMSTFVEFYTTMLGFVNYRLFQTAGLHYPPKLIVHELASVWDNEDEIVERVYSLAQPLQKTSELDADSAMEPDIFPTEGVDSEQLRLEWESMRRLKTLFQSCRFFLNREVPRESLTFIIRCCGGHVSWSDTPGATYREDDTGITHQIVDRNVIQMGINRTYIQPQWIYDSFNARQRLPLERYFPGAILPSHLSPFVDEKPGDYIPPERISQLRQLNKPVDHLLVSATDGATSQKRKTPIDKKLQTTSDDKSTTMRAVVGKLHRDNAQKRRNETGEQLRMREMMIPKKQRRVYHKIRRGQKKQRREVNTLTTKRAHIDSSTGATSN